MRLDPKTRIDSVEEMVKRREISNVEITKMYYDPVTGKKGQFVVKKFKCSEVCPFYLSETPEGYTWEHCYMCLFDCQISSCRLKTLKISCHSTTTETKSKTAEEVNNLKQSFKLYFRDCLKEMAGAKEWKYLCSEIRFKLEDIIKSLEKYGIYVRSVEELLYCSINPENKRIDWDKPKRKMKKARKVDDITDEELFYTRDGNEQWKLMEEMRTEMEEKIK